MAKKNKTTFEPAFHRNYGSDYRVPLYPRAGGGWKVKKENNDNCHVECSLVKNPTVYIELKPRHKIELLMGKYPSQEWIGYLVGRISEKTGNYFVEDLVIPPHKEAVSAMAEAEPFHIPDKCVGIIHSHHSMGAFHSGTDKDYVDKNFPISVVVANGKGQGFEFDTVSYHITECGKSVLRTGTVKYVAPLPTFDTEAFLDGAVANIDKNKRVYHPLPLHQGRFAPDTEYFTGQDGRVMTQTELDRHMAEIYGLEDML